MKSSLKNHNSTLKKSILVEDGQGAVLVALDFDLRLREQLLPQAIDA